MCEVRGRWLYLRDEQNEAKKASLDLIKSFESMPENEKIDWDFGGAKKKLIDNSTLTPDQTKVLLLLIRIFEKKDKRLIAELSSSLGMTDVSSKQM